MFQVTITLADSNPSQYLPTRPIFFNFMGFWAEIDRKRTRLSFGNHGFLWKC